MKIVKVKQIKMLFSSDEKDKIMNNQFKILVCGGRNFDDDLLLTNVLDKIHKHKTISSLVQGGSSGADFLAKKWAIKNSIDVIEYSAKWGKFGRSAGPIRNREMLREKPDLVIAFQGHKGTLDMLSAAQMNGVDSIHLKDHADIQKIESYLNDKCKAFQNELEL